VNKKSVLGAFFLLAVSVVFYFGSLGNNNLKEVYTTAKPQAAFEIYLVDSSIEDIRGKSLESLPLKKDPVFTDAVLKEYYWNIHEFTSTKDRLLETVPVSGLPFVMVVNGERIYSGFLWSYLSSLSPPKGPILYNESLEGKFKIQLLSNDKDARNDSRIYNTLKKLKKLKE
jgi:hypothetical protein